MKIRSWLPVGGKRPLTLPVQANGIASYFPSLPSKSEALRQFSAPRPSATLLDPNSNPSQRHSSAARPSSAVESDADELQLCSSSELLALEALPHRPPHPLSQPPPTPPRPRPPSQCARQRVADCVSPKNEGLHVCNRVNRSTWSRM